MDIEPAWLVGVVVLTLLTLLLTGPGMWSEKWGWSWFEKRRRRRAAHDERPGSRSKRD